MTAFARLAASPLILALLSPVALAQGDGSKPDVPEGVEFQARDIVSEGTRMSAEVYAPKGRDGERLPTVILCHGWGGEAKDLRPEAIAFAKAGYLAIALDYRGWGKSDGRLVLAKPAAAKEAGKREFTAEVREVREVVDPLDQTTDLLNAIHWAAGEPRCDPTRIGLWGSSYSGGHVVYAAARDRRVKALVSQVPALDSRWVLIGPARAQTLREATKRARGEAGYPEPGMRVVQGLKGAPIQERMMSYAPIDDVEEAGDCAMLFILAEKEEYFTNKDHGIKAHERAKGPKKLVTIPGIAHYGIYREARPQAQALAVGWFDEHLKAKSSDGAKK